MSYLIYGLGCIALLWLIVGFCGWYLLCSDQVIRIKDLPQIWREFVMFLVWTPIIWVKELIKEIKTNIDKKRREDGGDVK